MNALNWLLQVELNLLHWTLAQRERRLIAPCARAISRTGDGYLPVLTIALLLLAGSTHYRQMAWQLALLFMIERSIYLIAKNTLKRRRPADSHMSLTALIKAADEFSFPSGHTSAATLYSLFMLQHFPVVGLLLLPWAAAVGASRVILGVHYPTDILAGASLGFAIAAHGPHAFLH